MGRTRPSSPAPAIAPGRLPGPPPGRRSSGTRRDIPLSKVVERLVSGSTGARRRGSRRSARSRPRTTSRSVTTGAAPSGPKPHAPVPSAPSSSASPRVWKTNPGVPSSSVRTCSSIARALRTTLPRWDGSHLTVPKCPLGHHYEGPAAVAAGPSSPRAPPGRASGLCGSRSTSVELEGRHEPPPGRMSSSHGRCSEDAADVLRGEELDR
jgi:hypothetical protein